MILALRNVGPHEKRDLFIPEDGTTEIVGHSGAGKSALIDLLAWTLYGTDRHGRALTEAVVRRGAKEGSVSATFGKGTVIARGVKGKTVSRSYNAPGADAEAVSTDDALLVKMSNTLVGRDPVAVRTILFPGVWQRLAGSKLGGAALRDVLTRILPKGDLRGEVAKLMIEAEDTLAEQDPTDPKIAEDRRREAKQAHAVAVDRLARAKAAIVGLSDALPGAPAEAEVVAARALHADADTWRTYDAALGKWDAAEKGRAALVAEQAARRERRASLVAPPKPDTAAVTEALTLIKRLEAHLASLRDRATKDARLEAETTQAAQSATDRRVRMEAAGTTCHECGAVREVKGAAEALATAKRAEEEAVAEKATATKASESARAAIRTTEKQLADARTALDAARAPEAAYRTYEADLRACADLDIPRPETKPAEPSTARPTREALNEATATIANATKAVGATEERERRRESAVRAETAADAALSDAADAVAHLERLVDACRAAPGKVLAGQLAALGDLGTVKLDITDTGVTVLVRCPDGTYSPFDAPLGHSDGELVEADLYFRAALRRAAKLGWCHLWVDSRNALSRDLPDVGGKVIALRTGDGEIRVVAGVAAALAAK